MTDIAKCGGNGCPIKNSCYRFKAVAAKYWQSWIAEPYKNGECIAFIDVTPPSTKADK